jgi:preprotein translocase subunit SecY
VFRGKLIDEIDVNKFLGIIPVFDDIVVVVVVVVIIIIIIVGFVFHTNRNIPLKMPVWLHYAARKHSLRFIKHRAYTLCK